MKYLPEILGAIAIVIIIAMKLRDRMATVSRSRKELDRFKDRVEGAEHYKQLNGAK